MNSEHDCHSLSGDVRPDQSLVKCGKNLSAQVRQKTEHRMAGRKVHLWIDSVSAIKKPLTERLDEGQARIYRNKLNSKLTKMLDRLPALTI